MAEISIRRRTFHGTLWKIFDTGGTQFISLVISTILARLVMPDQFSAVAMMSIFIAISNILISSGFSTALIRKENRTQADYCTMFYFNIVVAIACYLIIFAIAPLVADFYDLPELTIMLRVATLSLIIGSISGVQRTIYTADLNFRALSVYNLISLVLSGSIGIYLAYRGFQVWALIGQSLAYSISSTTIIWVRSSWRPSWTFSIQSLKEFFGFGSKLLASGILETIYSNMQGIIIGKVFARPDLAFYNRAAVLNGFASTTPSGILQSVTYPALCKIKEDDERLREGYRNMIKVAAFVTFPLCMGLGAVAFPLINVLYTDIWIYAAVLLQIVVFAGMWYPIHALNLNLLIVKGRSDLFFRLEIVKKILGVCILCVTVPLGLEAMCYGGIVSSIICLIINTHYTGKLLQLGITKQFSDFGHILLLSMVMFAACRIVANTMGNGLDGLLSSILTGIVVYVGGAILFRFKEIHLLLSLRKS